MLGVTITNHLSAGEHVCNVIGKCAQSCTPWNCCTATAWATTRWGTSIQGRCTCQAAVCFIRMVGFYQRCRQTTSWSIYTTCRPAWLVHCRRSHSVTTDCWRGRRPLHKHTEQFLSILAPLFPDKTGHTYNLRARRHSFSVTVNTDYNNFMNILLY